MSQTMGTAKPGPVSALAVAKPPKFQVPERDEDGGLLTVDARERLRSKMVSDWLAESIQHRTMAIAAGDAVKLVDWTTGQAIKHLPIPELSGFRVTSVALAFHNGSLFLAAAVGTSIRVYDGATGQKLACVRTMHHSDRVSSVALTEFAGNLILASGAWDRFVQIWDPTLGRRIGPPGMRHDGEVRCVALGQQHGRLIVASGGYDKVIRLWDGISGAQLNHSPMQHEGDVMSVAFVETDNELLLASGGMDCSAKLWKIARLEKVECIREVRRQDAVWSVAAMPNTNSVVLASAGGDKVRGRGDTSIQMHLINCDGNALQSDRPESKALMRHEDAVKALALTEDGNALMVASGGEDHSVRIWSGSPPKSFSAATMSHRMALNCVALFEHAGELVVAAGGDDGAVRIWGGQSEASNQVEMLRHGSHVFSVSIQEHTGRLVVASGSENGTVQLWDGIKQTFLRGPLLQRDGFVFKVVLGVHHGRLVVAASDFNSKLHLLDTSTSEPLIRLQLSHAEHVRALAILSHEDRLYVASGSWANPRAGPSSASLWDGTTGVRLPHTSMSHHGFVHEVALTTWKGSLVLASGGSDCLVRIWDGATGSSICPPLEHGGIVNVMRFSADSRWLLTGSSDCFLRLWSVPDGRLLAVCPLETRPRAALFLKSGELAVAVDGHQPDSFSLLRFNLRNLTSIFHAPASALLR